MQRVERVTQTVFGIRQLFGRRAEMQGSHGIAPRVEGVELHPFLGHETDEFWPSPCPLSVVAGHGATLMRA